MYRHLMVPLDDSPLSVETVDQAVKLAATLGAKVTFFHAQADYGASSIGALERVMSPGRVQRARGRRGAGDPGQGRGRRAGGRRAARLRRS